LVAEIAGERPTGGDELRLSEDFHLDSLGTVQLAAALEERLTDAPKEGSVDTARTLGDLRRIVASGRVAERDERRFDGIQQIASDLASGNASGLNNDEQNVAISDIDHSPRPETAQNEVAVRLSPPPEKAGFIYPRWPWSRPMQWIRSCFLELIAQPFVWFLGNPRVVRMENLTA